MARASPAHTARLIVLHDRLQQALDAPEGARMPRFVSISLLNARNERPWNHVTKRALNTHGR